MTTPPGFPPRPQHRAPRELLHIEGPYGKADELPMLRVPQFAATVSHWLVTAPRFHPLWSQYSLSILRLADIPGMRPARKSHPDVTHEVCCVAINPDGGWQTVDTMMDYCTPSHPKYGKLPILTPVNLATQAAATDEEMYMIAPHLIRAIVERGVTPEPSDAPDRIRRYWAQMLSDALIQFRGGRDAWER
jgi:hypothetical protein